MSNQPSNKRATLRDVAQKCNLSLATVSRVLSHSDYSVSEKTREQVLAAAKALHYTPNALGRSLKTQNTRIIGVIIPNITNPYYAQLLLGIGDKTTQENYGLLMCNSHRSAEVENKGLEMLISERVAGILIVSIGSDSRLIEQALEMNIPVVTLEQKPANALLQDCCHIGFDYAEGAKQAVDHLYHQGHRRIAFVGAPPVYHSRREMLAGYCSAIENNHLPLVDELIWLGTEESDTIHLYELENGEACAQALTQLNDPPTAYLCINDQSAIGLIRGLQMLGIRVPEDVSVMGFDNIPQGELTHPSLTTIDQRAYEMGQLAVEELFKQIQDPDASIKSTMLKPTIIERDSVRQYPIK